MSIPSDGNVPGLRNEEEHMYARPCFFAGISIRPRQRKSIARPGRVQREPSAIPNRAARGILVVLNMTQLALPFTIPLQGPVRRGSHSQMYRTWRREFKLSGIPEEENVLGGDFPYGHLNSVYGTGLRLGMSRSRSASVRKAFRSCIWCPQLQAYNGRVSIRIFRVREGKSYDARPK